MLWRCLRAAGGLCLLFGLIPLLGYGILNTGVAVLLLAGAALLFGRRLWTGWLSPFPRLRKVVAVLCVLFAAYGLVLSLLMARSAWWNPPPREEDLPIIVLGSKINGDQPSLMLSRRLDLAVDYLADHPAAVCVVSGGQGPDEQVPEAHVMRDYLTAKGVHPDRILLEDRSQNTRQNLRYSRELLGGTERVVIATDGFHQLRAGVFAAAKGLRTYGISASTPWGLLPAYWVREWFGVAWAFVSTPR